MHYRITIVQARRALALLLTLGCAALLAACGSSSSSSSSSGAASGTSDAAAVTAARQAVDAGFKGNYAAAPASGPAAVRGKTVWILSAFQQVPSLAIMAKEAQAAARQIGWQSKVCDGQNNANGAWSTCVRQATASHADAIILESIDCAAVRQPLIEARRAGIKVLGMTAFDCSDPKEGASSSLFDVPSTYVTGVRDLADYYLQVGRLRAQWIIAQTNGRAKVLHVQFKGVAFGEYLSEGFAQGLARCAGCRVVGTVTITPPDVPQIRQKFESALAKVPTANAVDVDVDFMFTSGIQQALVAAHRSGLTVAGGECSLDNLGYIRSGGGQQMCIGSSLGSLAWSSIDAINRAFAGRPAVSSGIGWQIIDARHNLPAAGQPADGPVDYRAAYTKIWAGS